MSAARGAWTFELRARSSPDQRCTICHGGIGASALACMRCHTMYHEDCVEGHGRCPTLGCGARPEGAEPERPRPEAQTGPGWRRLWAPRAWLWARLVAITALASFVAWPILVGGVLGVILALADFRREPTAGLVGLLVSALAFLVGKRVYGVADAERAYQNSLRVLLVHDRPVRLRLWTAFTGGGPRVDLRPVGAGTVDPAELSVSGGVLGLPRWVGQLEPGAPVLVHGFLAVGGPVVLEEPGTGRAWAVPQERVARPPRRRAARRPP